MIVYSANVDNLKLCLSQSKKVYTEESNTKFCFILEGKKLKDCHTKLILFCGTIFHIISGL